MPVQNSLSSRIRDASIVIKSALIRTGKTVKDIEKCKIMNSNTFYAKQINTDRLKLSDLWRLDNLLEFTDEEILQMFGRHEKRKE